MERVIHALRSPYSKTIGVENLKKFMAICAGLAEKANVW
jgi:hypothetical protein